MVFITIGEEHEDEDGDDDDVTELSNDINSFSDSISSNLSNDEVSIIGEDGVEIIGGVEINLGDEDEDEEEEGDEDEQDNEFLNLFVDETKLGDIVLLTLFKIGL